MAIDKWLKREPRNAATGDSRAGYTLEILVGLDTITEVHYCGAPPCRCEQSECRRDARAWEETRLARAQPPGHASGSLLGGGVGWALALVLAVVLAWLILE